MQPTPPCLNLLSRKILVLIKNAAYQKQARQKANDQKGIQLNRQKQQAWLAQRIRSMTVKRRACVQARVGVEMDA